MFEYLTLVDLFLDLWCTTLYKNFTFSYLAALGLHIENEIIYIYIYIGFLFLMRLTAENIITLVITFDDHNEVNTTDIMVIKIISL